LADDVASFVVADWCQVLEPADEVSSVAYIAMLHYFGTKSRAGVVANLPSTVKVRGSG
jgi:hypothetical protein